MLKLTKRADYALIALRHLALQGTASAKDIADSYGIPSPLLAKVLQKLVRAGLLASLPGTNGGYRLARDPRKITALEVIRSIDGPVTLTSCNTLRGACGQSSRCTVRAPLRKVHESIMGVLGTITISEMSEDYADSYLSR